MASALSTWMAANYPTGWTTGTVEAYAVTGSFAWDPDMTYAAALAAVASDGYLRHVTVTGRTDTSGIADADDIAIPSSKYDVIDRILLVNTTSEQVLATIAVDVPSPFLSYPGDRINVAWNDGANKVFNSNGTIDDSAVTFTLPPMTGGFTYPTADIGGPWTFTCTVDTFDPPTTDLLYLTVNWLVNVGDDDLGGGPVTFHVVDATDTVIFDDTDVTALAPIDTSGSTWPLTCTLSGTTGISGLPVFAAWAIVDINLVETDELVNEVTDEIDIIEGGGPPPPPEQEAGSSLELYLIDDTDTPAWVDLVANDLGVLGTYTCTRTCSLQGPYIRQQAGRLTFTLDNGATAETDAGQWSPENPSSPWLDPTHSGLSLLRQGLPARVFLTPPTDGDPVQIWGGRVTEWPPDYTLGDLYSTVDVAAIDAVDRLQAANLPALQEPVGAGENAADRIARILDRIGYEPVSILDDTTYCTMQATTLERAAWDEITLTADSDGGYVFVDPAGRVNYLPRDFHVGLEPSIVFSSLAEGDGFGDIAYDADDLEFSAPQSTNDTAQQFNVIKFSPVGGIEQAAQADTLDPTDFYGIRAYERTDLICESNRQAMDLALFTIGLTRNVDLRFSRIQVDLYPQSPSAMWAAVIAVELLDKLRVKLKTPDGRIIQRDHLVSGITWTINDLQSLWRCVFDLAQAPPDYPLMEFDGTGDDAELDMDGLVAPWR